MYSLLRRLLFQMSAETAHYTAMNALKHVPLAKSIAKNMFHDSNPAWQRRFWVLLFKTRWDLVPGLTKMRCTWQNWKRLVLVL